MDVMSFVEKTIEMSLATTNPVRVLLVCNPHNPLGRVYPVEVIVGYAQLAEKVRFPPLLYCTDGITERRPSSV